MDEDLREIDSLFRAALYRAACPSSDQLLLYQAGLLEAAAAATVSAHIRFCNACQSDLALIAAPPEAGPGARLAAGFATARTVLRAVRAAAAAPALRGGPARTLRYTADAYQITLAVIPPPAPGALGQIEGQISGAAVPAGIVELLQNDAMVHTEAIDDLGFFAFDNITAGMYTLRLTVGETQIVVEELDL